MNFEHSVCRHARRADCDLVNTWLAAQRRFGYDAQKERVLANRKFKLPNRTPNMSFGEDEQGRLDGRRPEWPWFASREPPVHLQRKRYFANVNPGSFGGPPTILNEKRSGPSAFTLATIVPPLLYSNTSVVPANSYLPSKDCVLSGLANFQLKRPSLPIERSIVPPPTAGALQAPVMLAGAVS